MFRIVFVKFLQMINKKNINKNKNECDIKTTFIILCGKKSNRRGYKNIPLTLINEYETLIDRQINIINNNYKDSEIIIISGFEHEKLIDHIFLKEYKNVRIAENQNYKHTNTLDGWRIGLNLCISQNIYIIHGDRIFDDTCISHKNSKNTHTIIHDINKNNYNLGLLFDNEKFINMSYGLPNVWSEIFFINQKDFDITKQLINEYKKRKIYNIESFINELSKNIKILVVNKKQKDIKTLKEIK